MSEKRFTPSAVVSYLDQYVVGQAEAKKALAVAVYAHYRKLSLPKQNAVELTKSNVLLIGPSGSGKTLMCETLGRMLGVPFVTADATSLAQTRYVNEEIDAIIQRLLEKADGDIARAQRGIVFIDEVDKLKAGASPQGTSGEGVQNALLKIMEGATVKLTNGQYLDTTNLLFICGGAFVGLDKVMNKTHGYGFIATGDSDNQNILERLNTRVKPTDLFEFGLTPEFTGRLPIIINFHPLTKEMLARILVEPRNALSRQFSAIFRHENVTLEIAPKVFEQIAEIAFEYKTGARSLRGIFEEMITPILYEIPDKPSIRRVQIDSLFSSPLLLEQ